MPERETISLYQDDFERMVHERQVYLDCAINGMAMLQVFQEHCREVMTPHDFEVLQSKALAARR